MKFAPAENETWPGTVAVPDSDITADWPDWTDEVRYTLPWPPPESAEAATLAAIRQATTELGRQPRCEEIAAIAGRSEVITALALGKLIERGLVEHCFYDAAAFRLTTGRTAL